MALTGVLDTALVYVTDVDTNEEGGYSLETATWCAPWQVVGNG